MLNEIVCLSKVGTCNDKELKGYVKTNISVKRLLILVFILVSKNVIKYSHFFKLVKIN